jgi:hypothetical protein
LTGFIIAITASLVSGGVLTQSPRLLTKQLTCVQRINYNSNPTMRPWLVRGVVRWRRVESLAVYPDGSIVLSVKYRDAGSMECEARLDLAYLVRLREAIARTKVCGFKPPARAENEYDSLYVGLEKSRPCRIQVPPWLWGKELSRRAAQAAIDRLKADICGGACPEPTAQQPTAGEYFRNDTLRIVRPPDAAPPPPKKP